MTEIKYIKVTNWGNILGVLMIAMAIFFIGIFAWIAKSETKDHTIKCDLLKDNILGWTMGTVEQVCGLPWRVHYKMEANGVLITTWHYTGGDVEFRGRHPRSVEGPEIPIVVGWSK